tara:strand:+ start:370 stop:1716 length:1347 start_codon:yes stop_codon:yes gene_type:complete
MGNYFQPQVWGDKVLNPLRDSVSKYKQSQREAKADERYQQQLAWQQKVQGWKEKDYERQETARLRLKASNLSLSDATSGYLNKSWDPSIGENGVYTGSLRSVQDDVATYVERMKEQNLTPTPQEIQNATVAIGQARQQYVAGATEGLNQRIADWENKNKDIKGHLGQDDWNPFNNKDYENARKEFLEEIGANELYSQLSGVEGQHGASARTGLTPDDFKKSAFNISTPVAVAGGVGTLYVGNKVKNYITDAMEKSKVKKAEFQSQYEKDVKNYNKKTKTGGLTPEEFLKKYGVNKKTAKGKTSKEILKLAKQAGYTGTFFDGLKKGLTSTLKTSAYYAAPQIGEAIDESIGGTGGVGKSIGTIALLTKTSKDIMTNPQTRTLFNKFLKDRLPKAMAKQATKALARHGVVAATGIGATPFVQIPMLLLDAGMSIGAVVSLFKEFSEMNK